MRSFIFFSFLLFVTTAVRAELTKLAVITSEFDKNVMDFYIDTNDQNHIHSLRYVTTMPDGSIIEDISVPAQTVIDEGIVIVERDGREILRLYLEKFSLEKGGIVILNHLYNGIINQWENKRLNLMSDQGRFSLFDLSGKRVNRLFLKANTTILFGIVGIKEIQSSIEILLNTWGDYEIRSRAGTSY